MRLCEARKDIISKGCNLSRKLGFSTSRVATCESYGTLWITGFYLKKGQEEPDKKLWKRSKKPDARFEYCYSPKATNKDVLDQVGKLRIGFGGQLCKLLGLDLMRGFGYSVPGVSIVKEVAYIETSNLKKPPKDCKRISDIQYEKFTSLK